MREQANLRRNLLECLVGDLRKASDATIIAAANAAYHCGRGALAGLCMDELMRRSARS